MKCYSITLLVCLFNVVLCKLESKNQSSNLEKENNENTNLISSKPKFIPTLKNQIKNDTKEQSPQIYTNDDSNKNNAFKRLIVNEVPTRDGIESELLDQNIKEDDTNYTTESVNENLNNDKIKNVSKDKQDKTLQSSKLDVQKQFEPSTTLSENMDNKAINTNYDSDPKNRNYRYYLENTHLDDKHSDKIQKNMTDRLKPKNPLLTQETENEDEETDKSRDENKLFETLLQLMKKYKHSKKNNNNNKSTLERNLHVFSKNLSAFYFNNRCMINYFINNMLKSIQNKDNKLFNFIHENNNIGPEEYLNRLTEYTFPVVSLNPLLKTALDYDLFDKIARTFNLINEEQNDNEGDSNENEIDLDINDGSNCYKKY